MGGSSVEVSAYVTWAAADLVFVIQLPKRVPDELTGVVSVAWANGRVPSGGYWNLGSFAAGGYNLIGSNGSTFYNFQKIDDYKVKITMRRSTAWSTNNIPLSLAFDQFEITFIDPSI